ncbi:two-pore potassium channel 1 isoform X2 [Cajanus cajan]|uniref:two-pore potassium channel 1 isoform X2 n=1 Tax=Cajanus cajan TaxID=3821 RepID=UPI00098DC84F|nr:two-pore potassium channel 1 isoform X2 [Cajanus cajan]
MANNGVKVPLLSGSPDVTQKAKWRLNKRRLLRSRSAPGTDCVPAETNGNEPIPHTVSIFQNVHPSFKRVAIYLVVYLGVGALIFYLVRNQIRGLKTDGILDALYFTIVTMTTVGYGDLVPNSDLTKLLACAFVFSGMALMGLILSKAADYLVEKQEFLLVKAMRMHQKVFLYMAELNTESRQKELVKWVLTRKMTHLDLEAADLDEDGTVGAAEFVIYKLKEMGKISQEDISLVMQEFEELDVDDSGTLSASDITLAQSS